MKKAIKVQDRLRGLTNAIARYPLSVVFLLSTALINAVSINVERDNTKQLLTCIVGVVLCALLQAVYERFFSKLLFRIILMGGGVVLTAGYFFLLKVTQDLNIEIWIRTIVALFALGIAFIWVPVIRSRFSFDESFMAAWKAFFHALFYAVIIYIGCTLVNAAIDSLIVKLSYKSLSHIANITFVLFAPLFFLSHIPVYPGIKNMDSENADTKAQDELVKQAAFCPKFLEVLISYIVIPITAVFTIILLIYIILNIRDKFWSDNLLEPMLVSYAVTVIMITILTSRLENKFAILFRRIFPKLLIPIVLLQIVSSILMIRDTGITYQRYFAILFGIFAICTGILMSFASLYKNNRIAVMLIIFSMISVIPPVDAFTVSRLSQIVRLKSVLLQNKMLEDDMIVPNPSISDEDKEIILSTVQYLDKMSYNNSIVWMPYNFSVSEDFYNTFGFSEDGISENTNWSINVFFDSAVSIEGYDIFVHTTIDPNESGTTKICDFQKSGKKYTLQKEKSEEGYDIVLDNEEHQELIRFHTEEIFSQYRNYGADKSELSSEEATFTTENKQIKFTVIIQNASCYGSMKQAYNYADGYLLIQFK